MFAAKTLSMSFLFFIFFATIPAAFADSAESLYNAANSLEEQKQFDKAANGYQQMLSSFATDNYGQRAQIDIDKVAIIKLIESGEIASRNKAAKIQHRL